MSKSNIWGVAVQAALVSCAVAALALAEPPRAETKSGKSAPTRAGGMGQSMRPPGMHGGMDCPMMQGMHGMHGMHGMMGPDGPKDMPDADVVIEKTKSGAVIRIGAKNPADVAEVQRRALMIALHLGADPAALMPAAPESKK